MTEISYVPIDVLREIFFLTVDYDSLGTCKRACRTLTRVCCLWREIVLSRSFTVCLSRALNLDVTDPFRLMLISDYADSSWRQYSFNERMFTASYGNPSMTNNYLLFYNTKDWKLYIDIYYRTLDQKNTFILDFGSDSAYTVKITEAVIGVVIAIRLRSHSMLYLLKGDRLEEFCCVRLFNTMMYMTVLTPQGFQFYNSAGLARFLSFWTLQIEDEVDLQNHYCNRFKHSMIIDNTIITRNGERHLIPCDTLLRTGVSIGDYIFINNSVYDPCTGERLFSHPYINFGTRVYPNICYSDGLHYIIKYY